MNPVNEYLPTSPFEVLCQELNTNEITYGTLHEKFMSAPVPNMVVARIHLTLPPLIDGHMPHAHTIITELDAHLLYEQGKVICEYIDRVLIAEHPVDKRFLLRYLENRSLQFDQPEQKSVGYGHVVVYSREPLAAEYTGFDNSLYVPPLTGHWAIIRRK